MNKLSLVYSLTLLLSVASTKITRTHVDTFPFQPSTESSQDTSNSTNEVSNITVEGRIDALAAKEGTLAVEINGTLDRVSGGRSGTTTPTTFPAGSVVVYLGTFDEVDFISAQSTVGNFDFTLSSITEQPNSRKFISLVNQSPLMAGETFTITARLRAPNKDLNLFTNIGIGANPGSGFATVTPGTIRLVSAIGNAEVSRAASCSGSTTATVISLN